MTVWPHTCDVGCRTPPRKNRRLSCKTPVGVSADGLYYSKESTASTASTLEPSTLFQDCLKEESENDGDAEGNEGDAEESENEGDAENERDEIVEISGSDSDGSSYSDSCSYEHYDDSDDRSIYDVPDFKFKVPEELRPGGRGAPFGISEYGFKVLCYLGAPPIIFNMLFFINPNNGGPKANNFLIFQDGFAGIAWPYRVFSAAGYPSMKWDLKFNAKLHNICSVAGFLAIVTWTLQMVPGNSMSHLGVLCSSWVFMSSSKTLRSAANPMGTRCSIELGTCELRALRNSWRVSGGFRELPTRGDSEEFLEGDSEDSLRFDGAGCRQLWIVFPKGGRRQSNGVASHLVAYDPRGASNIVAGGAAYDIIDVSTSAFGSIQCRELCRRGHRLNGVLRGADREGHKSAHQRSQRAAPVTDAQASGTHL